MRCSFEAIVRDPGGRAFAVPRVEFDDFHAFNVVGRVNEEVAGRCGTRVTTLRCLSSELTADDHRHRRYELEAHGPVRGLEELEVETPPAGNPWELPGWFDETAAWIRERVDAPVEQRATRSISTVLRAGDAYFKAVPPFFGSEPAITRALAAEHPGRVPDVLDLDVERRWLLLRDFGGEQLAAAHPPETWVDALLVYADIQRAWIGREDELLAAGCPDRRLDRLERDLDVVLADVDAMLDLSEAELAELPGLRERLREVARRLERFELPPTLDHGDLHAGNVRVRDSGPLVYDWSDGCLTVPLLSVTPILGWDDVPEGSLPRLRDAYLERIGAPAEAFDDAIVVGFAHQSVSYYRMTEATAPHARWEWERVLPSLVRQLLERVPR